MTMFAAPSTSTKEDRPHADPTADGKTAGHAVARHGRRLEDAGTRSSEPRTEFPGTTLAAGRSTMELAREPGAGAKTESGQTAGAALLRELALARADGSLRHLLARLSRIDVLVIDDWAMAPLNETERREVWEICEDRYQTRSTILTSQLPVSRWHEQIGDPTIADGILDRLVHNAHRIEMRGESMRKKRNPPPEEDNQ